MPVPMTRRRTDPGTLLATTHEVSGGLRVRLRLTRPSDARRVRRFLDGLSAEARRLRFLAATPVVSEGIVRHFTFYNPRERLVVAATAPLGGTEEIVGLADVAHLSTGLAELGVVVDDAHQERGIGTLLAESIASLAAHQGATHLKAELLTKNVPMLRLMERLGPTVRTYETGNAAVYATLPQPAGRAA
jgi:RimJ/RimL family protein N-acetyltransferase